MVSERRAALNRIRTAETPVPLANPAAAAAVTQPVIAPKSVADNRVSDATQAVAHAAAVPSTPSDPRIVKQRRATTAQRRTGLAPSSSTAKTADTTLNGFMRRRSTIPALSFFAVAFLAGGSLFNPLQADVAQAAVSTPVLTKAPAPQVYTAHGTYGSFEVSRDGYEVTKPAPKVVTPPVTETDDTAATSTAKKAVTPSNSIAAVAATPDPGSAQAIALELVSARGWGTDQYNCLVSLWNKESGWRVNAYNPSGAYGIPQALPGSKMASAGADWQTNPATQITWGLNYISGVYGTPCGAWGHSQSFNWY
ncbi:transglycosylase SLT domain-containing protein [Curtobacterium sp. NPDC090217]|uniref:aggregation-promoting factor C-terminal-like domain-containing protein n=1 Tax=Curtobacterium sp. NPDC090217 TaxID=3363970 RepID=UPI00380D6370